MSDNNEQNVLSVLQSACEAALEGYPTTEEQDTAIMVDRGMFGALNKQQRMAVKVNRSVVYDLSTTTCICLLYPAHITSQWSRRALMMLCVL